jgi:hypothetical protein
MGESITETPYFKAEKTDSVVKAASSVKASCTIAME